MRTSNTKYNLTVAKLRSYDATISKPYDRTEYLRVVLKEAYGNDYDRIIKEIKECLGDLVNESDVAEFFQVMES